MERKRIQVYAEPEIKRRIELAAARRAMSVTQYCLGAIVKQLIEDDILERETVEIPVEVPEGQDLLADLQALCQKIESGRQNRSASAPVSERGRPAVRPCKP